MVKTFYENKLQALALNSVHKKAASYIFGKVTNMSLIMCPRKFLYP